MTAPPPVHDAEIVPTAPASSAAIALRPDVAGRDALALGWVQSYETDSSNTAERYARDVPGWTYRGGTIVKSTPRAPGSFFGWADEHGYDIGAMLPWHVEQYIRYLTTAEHIGRYTRTQRLSKSTIAGKVAAVSSFFRYAARQNRDTVVHNPVVGARRPKPRGDSPTRCLDRDEVDAMLAAAQGMGRREYALIMLMVTAGLRASEVCSLDTSDLGREGSRWVVRAQRKGRGGDTTLVPVADVTARALKRHMRGRRGPMFQRADGQRMTRQALAYTIGVVARAAFPRAHRDDADPAAGITPHTFRHTCTTLLLRSGVAIQDVQQLMDHASISTTEGYFKAGSRLDNPAVDVLDTMFDDGLPDVNM